MCDLDPHLRQKRGAKATKEMPASTGQTRAELGDCPEWGPRGERVLKSPPFPTQSTEAELDPLPAAPG